MVNPTAVSSEFAKDVNVTPIKESTKAVAVDKTSNTAEVKNPNPQGTRPVKESKSKRAATRASLIREIFQTSTGLGMNIGDLKSFIAEVTSKSIAESSDLSDADLPLILDGLHKLQAKEKAA